jgi:hypothetical protein
VTWSSTIHVFSPNTILLHVLEEPACTFTVELNLTTAL